MRKFIMITAICLLPLAAAGQSATKPSKKTVNITGKVAAGGSSFVAEKDSRIWKVLNPELLKENDGGRVVVRAYANADVSELRVVSVHAIVEGLHAKVDDVAFRK